MAASQEYSKAERLELAKRSRTEPPMFGSAERQRLTRELHERLLAREAVRMQCAQPCFAYFPTP